MDTLHILIIVSVPILVPIVFFLILFLVITLRKVMRGGGRSNSGLNEINASRPAKDQNDW